MDEIPNDKQQIPNESQITKSKKPNSEPTGQRVI
jgi:hypothetical protein